MSLQILILLHGDQGAGKDATAEILVREHGFTRFAFADRLRELCLAMDPVITYEIDHKLIAQLTRYQPGQEQQPTLRPVRLSAIVERYGWDEAKRRYPEVRRTQQKVGTEVGRAIDSDYWADYVEAQLDGVERAVITDVRFPNEGGIADRRNGEVWWVRRANNPHQQATAHDSEVWHPDVYAVLRNDGTLRDLAENVRKLLAQNEREQRAAS